MLVLLLLNVVSLLSRCVELCTCSVLSIGQNIKNENLFSHKNTDVKEEKTTQKHV